MRHLRPPVPLKETAINCVLGAVFGNPAPYVQTYLDLISRVARHNGEVQACKYAKDLYTQATHVAMRRTVTPIPFRKSDSAGIDRNLRCVLPDLQSDDPKRIRRGLTVVRLCYLIRSPPKVNVKSITSPPGAGWSDAQYASFSEFAFSKVEPKKFKENILLIPRARSGPNGPSSLLSSHLDAVALTRHPKLLSALDSLAKRIQGLDRLPSVPSILSEPTHFVVDTEAKQAVASDSQDFGLKDWVEAINVWCEQKLPQLKERSLVHSRLAALAEGGCKTRIIAIGDLFTQIVLLPVHQELMGRLARIDQDGTYDQSRSTHKVREWTRKGPLYSFDLTNATDRFPVEITRRVLSAAFGEVFSQLWKTVMVDRDFSLPHKRDHTVRYGAGQPMGLYSSWPAFAYSHHIFVQYCAHLEGINPFEEYTIIGDDVVIAHPAVARRYRNILSDFEVPISEAKSIVSETAPYCGEICKQIFRNGVNLSPIPADLILGVCRHYTYLPALIEEIHNRYESETLPAPSQLLKLADLYSRKDQRNKALKLLTAPSLKALMGNIPEGNHHVTGSRSCIQEPGLDPGQMVCHMASGRYDDPWKTIDPEVMSDFEAVLGQLRKVTVQRQLEMAWKTWHDLDTEPLLFEGVPLYPERKPGLSDHRVDLRPRHETGRFKHPVELALDWTLQKVFSTFTWYGPLIEYSEDMSFEEFDLRYAIDPTLRSYQDRRARRSISASHLTLETFKVLSGQAPYPQYEHPPDGFLTAWVKFTAG